MADKATGYAIATYSYDALGRRIMKLIHVEGEGVVFTPVEYYYYDGDRVVEIPRKVKVGDPTVGNFLADVCTTGACCIDEVCTVLAQGACVAAGGEYMGDNSPCTSKTCEPPSSRPPPPTGEKRMASNDGSSFTLVKGGVPEPVASGIAPKKQPRTNFAAQAQTEVRSLRRFVYGMDYVNEVVAQIPPANQDGSTTVTPDLRLVLQDANYNVVGISRACDGELIRQMRYTPYGQLTAVEDGAGDALPSTTATDFWHGFQGMLYDRETSTDGLGLNGHYYANARTYNPVTGRWHQRDPNGQALSLANTLAMNGQTRRAFANLSASGQYGDGMSLYAFVGGNPVNGSDPSGMIGYTYQGLLTTQSTSAYVRSAGVLAVGGLMGLSAFQGARSGYEAYLDGASSSQIASAAVKGAGHTGFESIARVLLASAIIATGPGGLALAAGVGLFETSEAYNESRSRQESAQTQAELSLATYDSIFASLGVAGSLYGSSHAIRGAAMMTKFAMRPKGVPRNWPSNRVGNTGGVKWSDPANPHNNVRVMPGKQSAPYANSRKPYVRHFRNGQPLDVNGSILDSSFSEAAHIPLALFRYKP